MFSSVLKVFLKVRNRSYFSIFFAFLIREILLFFAFETNFYKFNREQKKKSL